MTRRTKQWIAGVSLVVTAGGVLLNVLAFNHARAMMSFTPGGPKTQKPEQLSLFTRIKVLIVGVNLPRPVSARQPSELSSQCHPLAIAAPGRLSLGAWYCNRGPDTPLVILFHGYGSEKSGLIPEAKVFLDLGASVMLVDFRGSGDSSEAYTTIGIAEADDVATVVRYAREHLPHSSIVLFGKSMGAAAILRAVHVHGIAPDAVILEAVFDTLMNTVRHRFQAMGVPSFPSAELLVFWGGRQQGFNGFSHEPVCYATSLKGPALFMHGTRDPRATLPEGRRVCAAVPGVKVFKEFENAGHESYISIVPDEWKATVSNFLKKYAGGNNPSGSAKPSNGI